MYTPIAALVIENDAADYCLLERQFLRLPIKPLIRASSLNDNIEASKQHNPDIVLPDLTLPDSQGMGTVNKLTGAVVAPIVVLSGCEDNQPGLESVQLGDQDYQVKGNFNTRLLFQTIRYAIERNKLRRELHTTRQEVNRERELPRLQTYATPSLYRSDSLQLSVPSENLELLSSSDVER